MTELNIAYSYNGNEIIDDKQSDDMIEYQQQQQPQMQQQQQPQMQQQQQPQMQMQPQMQQQIQPQQQMQIQPMNNNNYYMNQAQPQIIKKQQIVPGITYMSVKMFLILLKVLQQKIVDIFFLQNF